MNKKKIIFVMESLRIGGAEKSLVTILSLFDYEKYDVDLYLFRQSGEFLGQLPKSVRLIEPGENTKIQNQNFKTAWFIFLCKGRLKRSFYSLKWLFSCFFSKYILRKQEFYGWNMLARIYDSVDGNYDTAIGFLEKRSTYFLLIK